MALLQRAINNSYRAYANSDAFLLFLKNRKDHIHFGGLDFIYHYYDPRVNNTSTNPPRVEKRDHLMPPYEPFVEIGHFSNDGACHYIILNRYQFCPGHIIIALDSQAELQGSPLMPHDFSIFSQILQQVDDRGVAYYNGGVDAGCTQYHKHMQYVPEINNPLFEKIASNARLPFVYFTEKLVDYRKDTIGRAYRELMLKMDHSGSYNFIISRGIAAIVPRRQARHKTGVLVNSMGVLGHMFVWNFNAKEAEANPIDILKTCCVPSE